MDDLTKQAQLIKQRNRLEEEITAVIGRPDQIGHLGEYIAAHMFNIQLEESAVAKSLDGYFKSGPVNGRSVNIKWYAKQEGLLDITPDSLPDYYLVLAGPKVGAVSSRGKTRPWLIESVHLFDTHTLVVQLKQRKLKIGVATSVRQAYWEQAEIYPMARCSNYSLTTPQREMLTLFS